MMKSYKQMTKDELMTEKALLEKRIEDYKAMNLSLNMTRGKPAPEQLDLSNNLFDDLSKGGFNAEDGTDTRNYGVANGLPEVRKFFADVLNTKSENIYVGNGSSLNLMFDSIMRAMVFGEHDSPKPWAQVEGRKWLCPVPGYDRHFRVTETCGFELVTVPMTENGPDMDVVEELVKDPTVLGMWNVPCYSNPDGFIYSEEVCRRLASMKTAAPDFRLYWDNAYCVHHLYEDKAMQGSIPDILSLCEEAGNASRVYEFASTSKVTFASSGISCIACNQENFKYAAKILGTQTIGANKINQLAHIRFMPDVDALNKQMMKQAMYLRPKFELTLEILERELAGTEAATWHKPLGGYFISVYTVEGTAKRVIAMCNDLGVAFTPACATYPYGKDPSDSNIRVAPSFPSLEDINKAVEVFAVCVKLSAVEKLLAE